MSSTTSSSSSPGPPPDTSTGTPSSSGTPSATSTPPPPVTTITPPPLPTTTTSLTSDTSTNVPTLLTTSTSSSSTTTTTPTSTPTLPTNVTPTPTPVGVTTTTSIVIISSSRNIAPTGAVNASSSKGFFKNTGAVAGVFTVVGLIALAILIALVTNSIRRRRAKRFDDEIAAAARDAANAQVPNFYDEDDDYRAGYGPSGGKYSDISHGTFAQPPLNPAPDMYGMRERAQGPAPGEYFDFAAGAASAGAAGIGVARARSMRDGGYAAGLQEGASPYAAFAAPGTTAVGTPGAAGSHYPPGMIRGAGGPEFDLTRRPSQYTQHTQQTDHTALSRNKSVTSAEGNGSTAYPSSSSTSPAPSIPKQDLFYNQYPQQRGYPNSFGAYAAPAAPNPPVSVPSLPEEDLSEAYDGYVVDEPAPTAGAHPTALPPGSLPNPFASGQAEYAGSDDEQEQPRRVLKVANE